MQLDIIDTLEKKIQQTLDTITLLQMELDEQKEKSSQLDTNIIELSEKNKVLQQQNEALLIEQEGWRERIKKLLGQLDTLN